MGFKDLFAETISSLFSNKARSALTILGIVVGIASVIAMLAIGNGATSSITDSIASSGADQMSISYQTPTDTSGKTIWSGQSTLTNDDLKVVSTSPYVKKVLPVVSTSNYELAYGDNDASGQITGTTPAYFSSNNLNIKYGSLFGAQDNESKTKVAVLGFDIAEDLYGEGNAQNAVGTQVRIGSMIFTVSGVLASKDSSFSSSNDKVFVPITTAQQYMTGASTLNSIVAIIKDTNQSDMAKADITGRLLTKHNIADADEADFSISAMADLIDTVSDVTGTLIDLLAAIAGISLIVGGIGIMNMMLTSVSERRREIGLRKAIGAEESAITLQFLAESVVLTILGGIVGILVGWAIAAIAGHFMGINAIPTLFSVFLATGVCVAIGILFGYYPAHKAARLNPIDALRAE